MDLEDVYEELAAMSGPSESEILRERTEAVHEAMMMMAHVGYPIGSTDAEYCETVARQADLDVDETTGIILTSIEMSVHGNIERNSSRLFH